MYVFVFLSLGSRFQSFQSIWPLRRIFCRFHLLIFYTKMHITTDWIFFLLYLYGTMCYFDEISLFAIRTSCVSVFMLLFWFKWLNQNLFQYTTNGWVITPNVSLLQSNRFCLRLIEILNVIHNYGDRSYIYRRCTLIHKLWLPIYVLNAMSFHHTRTFDFWSLNWNNLLNLLFI